MRRRRGRGGSSGAKGSAASGRRQWSAGERRGLLVALGVGVLGLGSGYFVATQVVYAAPEGQVEEFRTVPDLRGMEPGAAAEALREAGLRAGRVDSIRHPRVEAGRIVGQTPLPGQLALADEEVEFALSLGAERRPVPDVTRLIAQRAALVLGTTGFEVEVDSIDADLPAGRVVETDPPAGEMIEIPALVRISVSLGPPLVELPDLVGLQEEEARALLESLGLEVGEVQVRQRFGFNRGEVLEQLPAAGEEVPRGGEVHLVVGARGPGLGGAEDWRNR